MSRKGFSAERRKIKPDSVYHEVRIGKFINILMRAGKKSIAEGIAYGAFDLLDKHMEKDQDMRNDAKGHALVVFKRALDNVKPMLEVKSRRVGGSTYQVPVEVKLGRQESLGMRWLVDAAKERGLHSMQENLAAEIVDAFYRRGGAYKKREDVHRMAEANKAFAHYRW